MKKQGALSKIREGEIGNQWFREPKMTIVPRPSQERRKRVARESQESRAKRAKTSYSSTAGGPPPLFKVF